MNTSALTLPVMETFYTVQGEGQFAGTPAFFIRLGGCDVGCVWCDVKDSWDASKHPQISIDQLAQMAHSSGAPIVVVTGGEPAMYDLTELTMAIQSNKQRTHIETSGVYKLTGTWDWVTFSPKKFKAPIESIYPQASELKIVVFHSSDLVWATRHSEKVGDKCELFLQAEWEKRHQINSLIIDHIRKNTQWRISVQTHKYLGVD